MNILLLGRDTSVTNTIRDMLKSVEEWSVTKSFSIKKMAGQNGDNSDDKLYDLIVANLEDYSSPPTSVINKILAYFPSSYLLVLYIYSQEMLVNPLLKAGADGYLQNGAPEDQLLEAVKNVANGNQYIHIENTY